VRFSFHFFVETNHPICLSMALYRVEQLAKEPKREIFQLQEQERSF
jgi:hypothetical protein